MMMTLIVTMLGAAYLGYTIGIVHGAITAAKEIKKKEETVNLYQTMIAQLTAMTNAFIEQKAEKTASKQDKEV